MQFSDLANFQEFQNMSKTFENSKKINRKSDENVFYMKVSQNDEMNPDT